MNVPDADKDRQLLALLSANAREPLASLARKLGVARSSLQERIGRLERSGVIRGYGVRLGAALAPATRAFFLVQLDGPLCERIAPQLAGLAEVVACHSIAGDIDMLLEVAAGDLAGLDAVRARIGALAGVRRVQTLLVLKTRFERR